MSTSDTFGSWISGLEQSSAHNTKGNGILNGLGNGVGAQAKGTWPLVPASAHQRSSDGVGAGPAHPGLQDWEIALAKEPGFAPRYVDDMFDAEENAAYEQWLVTASVDDLAADYDAALPDVQGYEPVIALRARAQQRAAEEMAASAHRVYEASCSEARLFPQGAGAAADLTLRDVLESTQPQDVLTRFSDKHIACDRLTTNDNLMHLAMGGARMPEHDLSRRLDAVEARLAQRKSDASAYAEQSHSAHTRRLARVDPRTLAFVSELG